MPSLVGSEMCIRDSAETLPANEGVEADVKDGAVIKNGED